MPLRRDDRIATHSPRTLRMHAGKTERTKHVLAPKRRNLKSLTFYFLFAKFIRSALVIFGMITVASPSIIMRFYDSISGRDLGLP
jgi:hypothetical protein